MNVLRSSARVVAAALSCVLALAACGDETPPRPPASFNRPNRVAFFCVSRDDDTVVAASNCDSTSSRRGSYGLHALVTQSSRGEVAAVDLDFAFVIDSRRDIPGYTFVPVGELPSALLVPPEHPERTYVANFGSREIHVLRTQAFLSLAPGDNPIVQVVPLLDGASEGSPVDMVLSPSEDALYVATPADGSVWRLPLERCEDDAPSCEDGLVRTADMRRIDLRGSAALMQAPMSPQPAERYERMCGFERPAPPMIEQPTVDVGALAEPRPSAFAVDGFCEGRDDCTPRLLVADGAQPFIHTIDLDTGELGAPLVAGTPTRDVVVTPPVPVSLEQPEQMTQYVYAIDATDGSVLALESGQIVSIDADPNGRADRVPLGPSLSGEARAVVIDVLSPVFDHTDAIFVTDDGLDNVEQWCDGNRADAGVSGFREIDDGQCLDCDHVQQNPRRLRGVFLAAALSDGSLRIIDVHDMELNGDPASSCRVCPPANVPVIARHHPRLEANFIPNDDDEPMELRPRRGEIVAGVPGQDLALRLDGTTGSEDAPGLACIACTSGLQQIFPDLAAVEEDGDDLALPDAGMPDGGIVEVERCPEGAPALVCAAADPWMALEENWALVYEGVIPGTRAGRGRLAPNDERRLELTGDIDFCSFGVLGEEDDPRGLADDDEEPRGDQVIFLSPVLPDDQIAADDQSMCDELADLFGEGELAALPVRRAFEDRLVVGYELIEPLGDVRLYTDLQKCIGRSDLQFQVHTRAAYTVVGSRSGFEHGVAAVPDGRCRAPSGTVSGGRAFAGVTYNNGRIELQPRAPEGDALPVSGSGVFAQIASSAEKVYFDANAVSPFSRSDVVPVELRYNHLDRRLYLIDIHVRGLVPISLDPLLPTSSVQFD